MEASWNAKLRDIIWLSVISDHIDLIPPTANYFTWNSLNNQQSVCPPSASLILEDMSLTAMVSFHFNAFCHCLVFWYHLLFWYCYVTYANYCCRHRFSTFCWLINSFFYFSSSRLCSKRPLDSFLLIIFYFSSYWFSSASLEFLLLLLLKFPPYSSVLYWFSACHWMQKINE